MLLEFYLSRNQSQVELPWGMRCGADYPCGAREQVQHGGSLSQRPTTSSFPSGHSSGCWRCRERGKAPSPSERPCLNLSIMRLEWPGGWELHFSIQPPGHLPLPPHITCACNRTMAAHPWGPTHCSEAECSEYLYPPCLWSRCCRCPPRLLLAPFYTLKVTSDRCLLGFPGSPGRVTWKWQKENDLDVSLSWWTGTSSCCTAGNPGMCVLLKNKLSTHLVKIWYGLKVSSL